MKTYLVLYVGVENDNQLYTIHTDCHNKAMEEAYKKHNVNWKESDSLDNELLRDFYINSEVIAIIDSSPENVEITYQKLAYKMPINFNIDI